MPTDDPIPARVPPPPIPNSYWVEPGRLLAGEYPGSISRAEEQDRIQRLLRAGVTSFVNLTQEGELPAYEALLPQQIQHLRLPIVDHGLPESPQVMTQILDAIGAALASGRCVYVHCRAGIGRTGTAIGCHLVRSGYTPDQALEQLQKLWRQCARSRSWPSIPETDEQWHFVRNWREAAGKPGPAERCEGALAGLAIGDALGGLLASGRYDSQQLAQFAVLEAVTLATGADTAMTLAVAESLLALGRHDAEDQMQRYLQWSRTVNATGSSGANIPAEFKRALSAWQWSRKANVATHDPKNLDPHTLARSLAAALSARSDPQAAMNLAADVSRTTHQSPVVLDVCRFWTALLLDALSGIAKPELLTLSSGAAMQLAHARRLRKELDGLLQRRWAGTAPDIAPGPAQDDRGVLSVCALALIAFENTDSFEAGLLAIDPAPAAATVGALYGAIAGAHYGVAAIPEQWLRALPQQQSVRVLARRFAE